MVKLKNPDTGKHEEIDDYHYYDVTGHFPQCEPVKAKILNLIDDEIASLQEGCPKESCPLSNYDRGRKTALQDLKRYIEGI